MLPRVVVYNVTYHVYKLTYYSLNVIRKHVFACLFCWCMITTISCIHRKGVYRTGYYTQPVITHGSIPNAEGDVHLCSMHNALHVNNINYCNNVITLHVVYALYTFLVMFNIIIVHLPDTCIHVICSYALHLSGDK